MGMLFWSHHVVLVASDITYVVNIPYMPDFIINALLEYLPKDKELRYTMSPTTTPAPRTTDYRFPDLSGNLGLQM